MRRTPLFVPISLASSVAVLGLGALFSACGSSGSSPVAPSGDGGDASLEGAAVEAAADAGPDINQDPNVYPAKHQPIAQIDYGGGPILEHIRVVTVTFTGNPHRDTLRAFGHFITSSGWWKLTAEGYCVDGGPCVGDGTSAAPDGGAWIPDGSTQDAGDGYLDVELPYDLPLGVDDTAIGPWLGGHIAAGDFPAPDDQTVYVVYFPFTTTISLQNQASCSAFGGYHSYADVKTDGGSLPVAYAVIPDCDPATTDPVQHLNDLTLPASHELAESATDPQVGTHNAFYLRTNDAWLGAFSYGGGENGDMCTYVAQQGYSESSYDVQRIWSNSAAAASKNPCQPWDVPYYGAAVRTPLLNVGDHQSYGYVVVKRGQSVDVIADVFSERALPASLQLYVGMDKGPGHAPADVGALDPLYISAQLSQSVVRNGDGVILTFGASLMASRGDTRVVVRSILLGQSDPTMLDYNDWPIILRVQ